MTGQADRELDFAAMQAGAADYLIKGQIDAAGLERVLRYALQQKRNEVELETRVRERTSELAQANRAFAALVRTDAGIGQAGCPSKHRPRFSVRDRLRHPHRAGDRWRPCRSHQTDDRPSRKIVRHQCFVVGQISSLARNSDAFWK